MIVLILSVQQAKAKGKFMWWIGGDGYVVDSRILGEWRLMAVSGRKADQDFRVTVTGNDWGKPGLRQGVYTIRMLIVPPTKWNLRLGMVDLGQNRYGWIGLATGEIEMNLPKTDSAFLLYFTSLRYEIVMLNIQPDRIAIYDMHRLLPDMNRTKIKIYWSTDPGQKMILNHISELEEMLSSVDSEFEDIIPDAVFEKVVDAQEEGKGRSMPVKPPDR
ncbi:MAG: hypothetical protein HY343_00525 [Lentisphaerae bacterium]|nr:hypothetical protein [Lentisphaerota bacterium]